MICVIRLYLSLFPNPPTMQKTTISLTYLRVQYLRSYPSRENPYLVCMSSLIKKPPPFFAMQQETMQNQDKNEEETQKINTKLEKYNDNNNLNISPQVKQKSRKKEKLTPYTTSPKTHSPNPPPRSYSATTPLHHTTPPYPPSDPARPASSSPPQRAPSPSPVPPPQSPPNQPPAAPTPSQSAS